MSNKPIWHRKMYMVIQLNVYCNRKHCINISMFPESSSQGVKQVFIIRDTRNKFHKQYFMLSAQWNINYYAFYLGTVWNASLCACNCLIHNKLWNIQHPPYRCTVSSFQLFDSRLTENLPCFGTSSAWDSPWCSEDPLDDLQFYSSLVQPVTEKKFSALPKTTCRWFKSDHNFIVSHNNNRRTW